MSFPKVVAVIINWNGIYDTIQCLNSFKRVKYPDLFLLVIDNGSEQNEAKKLREMKMNINKPIEFVRINKNLGFCGGANLGIKLALNKYKADYVLLMNNDVVVDPTFLIELINSLSEKKSYGLASPLIYYFDDPKKVWWGGKKLNMWTGSASMDFNSKQLNSKVTDAVTGCCMLVKKEVFEKVGLLDEKYFLSGVDTIEYSYRARKNGFFSLIVPKAKIWHKCYQSTKKLSFFKKIRVWFDGKLDNLKLFLMMSKPYQFPSLILFFFIDIIHYFAIYPFRILKGEAGKGYVK